MTTDSGAEMLIEGAERTHRRREDERIEAEQDEELSGRLAAVLATWPARLVADAFRLTNHST